MTLLNQGALVLLVLLPLLILLYFLKLRRPPVTVSSTLLWQRVLNELRVNSPFQRLRRNLLLLLQLLLLSALIFALARPQSIAPRPDGESVIVLLDNSASMQAEEVDGRPRMDEARDEVESLLKQIGGTDEMMLITYDCEARILQAFTNDRHRLRQSLDKLQPTDCPSAFGQAMTLATSVANSRQHPRIVVISDAPPVGDTDAGLAVESVVVGTPRPNLAISALDVRRQFGDPKNVDVFVSVQNFSDQPASSMLLMQLDGQTVDTKYITVPPNQRQSRVFRALTEHRAVFAVTLVADDALTADNKAWQVLEPLRQPRVRLFGTPSPFLVNALRATGVQLTLATNESDATDFINYAMTVWNKAANPGTGTGNHLYIGCLPDPKMASGALASPNVSDWDNTHPINRFIDFGNLRITKSLNLHLPPTATPILSSDDSPLIGSWRDNNRAQCLIGFDLADSNWPFLVSFPIFLQNCLRFFAEDGIEGNRTNLQVGQPIPIPATFGHSVGVDTPDGEHHRVTSGGRTVFFAGTRTAGLYRLAGDAAPRNVAVNLFDDRESDLRQRALVHQNSTLTVVPLRRELHREYWKLLLLLALLLLTVEWVVYHRRVG